MPLDTTTRPTTPSAGPTGGGWPPADSTAVATPPPPRTPRAPRERSVLGPITIALALIAAGVAAALDASAGIAIDLGATGVAAVALLTLGLGLLVGSVWGRARWLLLVALLMMPFIGLGVLVREAEDQLGIDVDVSSGVGERRVDLVGSEPLPDGLELLAGSIDVDLSAWRPVGDELDELDGDVDLRIDLGAGEVDIEMPADVAWRVTSELGLGEYRVRGDDVRITDTVEDTFPFADGEEFGSTFVREGGPEGGPVLDVVIDVGVGQITIRETAPADTGDLDTTTDDDEELS